MVYKVCKFIGGLFSICIFIVIFAPNIPYFELIMDKFFPYAQFGGCVAFFLISAMLIFSRTFDSRHKQIYKRARLMLILSQLALAFHFLIQFNTGWRSTDPEKAILCNMVFFPISGILMMFSLLFMFTKGEINNKVVFWCIWTYVTITSVLIYAYINREILYSVECTLSTIYIVLFTILALYIRNQFKDVRTRMDNYFSQDTTTHTDWMATTIACMVVFILCVPFAILTNSGFLKCITLLNFAAIIFFVNRFIYYGYDIQKMIDRYFEMIEADTISESIPYNEIQNTQKGNKALENAILNWVEKKRYTEPELTINDLVKQTGYRRTVLTNYLNCHLNHTFRSWLNELRIEEAKKIMIEHPDYSHESIADLTGFSSRTYFLKVFKDKEGLPPGDWLKAQE